MMEMKSVRFNLFAVAVWISALPNVVWAVSKEGDTDVFPVGMQTLRFGMPLKELLRIHPTLIPDDFPGGGPDMYFDTSPVPAFDSAVYTFQENKLVEVHLGAKGTPDAIAAIVPQIVYSAEQKWGPTVERHLLKRAIPGLNASDAACPFFLWEQQKISITLKYCKVSPGADKPTSFYSLSFIAPTRDRTQIVPSNAMRFSNVHDRDAAVEMALPGKPKGPAAFK